MNPRIYHSITGRLSLRPPQAESLHKLGCAIAAAPDMIAHARDVSSVLTALQAEFPKLVEFERDFPSLVSPWPPEWARPA